MPNAVTTIDAEALHATIDAEALHATIDAGDPVLLLDVRSPAEFETAHIPGAHNLPVDQLAREADRVRPLLEGTTVLVCQTGPRAEQAQRILGDGPRVLSGGMNAWDDGDKPVERGRQRWALERQVRLVAGSIVLTGIVASTRWGRAKFLAGAIGAGLTFSAASNTCAMGSLLMKLPYNKGAGYDLDDAIAGLGTR